MKRQTTTHQEDLGDDVPSLETLETIFSNIRLTSEKEEAWIANLRAGSRLAKEVDLRCLQICKFIGRSIRGNLALPREDCDRLGDAVARISGAIYRMRWVPRDQHPDWLWDRLAPIYVKSRDLLIAMRGTSLLYAKYVGDRRPLAEFIRLYGCQSQEMRNYVADLIEKKERRSSSRPRAVENDKRDRAITWFILRARQKGMKPDSSINAAVDKFNLGRRWIQKIFEDREGIEAAHLASVTSLLQEMESMRRDLCALKE